MKGNRSVPDQSTVMHIEPGTLSIQPTKMIEAALAGLMWEAEPEGRRHVGVP